MVVAQRVVDLIGRVLVEYLLDVMSGICSILWVNGAFGGMNWNRNVSLYIHIEKSVE